MQSYATTGTNAAPRSAADRIELFEYPANSDAADVHDWSGLTESTDSEAQAPAEPDPGFEQRLAEETKCAFEQGRERGRQEGRQAEREATAAALKTAHENRIRQMAGLAESFAAARDCYLRDVEQEVVKLALAIAARVLRREAQMDPLLLTGAARVALGQLSSTTEVKLRVPSSELDLWIDAIHLLPNLSLKPAIVAGEGMRAGECIVETMLGTVDLGIRAQLAEIERGFFDRVDIARADAGRPSLDAVSHPDRRA